MSDDKKYNGWTNYETWVVKLWMDNDSGSYDYWRDRAQELWDDSEPGTYEWETREKMFVRALSEALKDEHEENAPTNDASVYADLMNAALSEVNWHEIAETYLEDIDREEEPEEDEEEVQS